jgi:uncharacterized protein YlxW (UPF0749 family)
VTGPRPPDEWPPPVFGGHGRRDDEYGLTDLFRNPLDSGYADAARRRAERGAAPAPRRFAGRGGFLASLVAVGLLFAVAYQQVVAAEPTRAQVRADLEEQIHAREDVTDQLQADAEALRENVARLRDELLGDAEVRQLRDLEAVTGLAQVRGAGAVVEVDDGPPIVDPATGAEVIEAEARILDLDLQQIANGLWAAGAEAIEINGRRLTATSTIRGASGAILVDRRPVAGPYKVAAVGPDDLADRYRDSPTDDLMWQLVEDYGIAYEVRAGDDLTVAAAAGPQLRYATPGGNP